MCGLTRLIGTCASRGENIGIYAERLLDDPLPRTRMRAVYRLLGLVRRYGPGSVEAAPMTLNSTTTVNAFAITFPDPRRAQYRRSWHEPGSLTKGTDEQFDEYVCAGPELAAQGRT